MQDARTHIAFYMGRHATARSGMWTYSFALLRELLAAVAGRSGSRDYCIWAIYSLPAAEQTEIKQLAEENVCTLRLAERGGWSSRKLSLAADAWLFDSRRFDLVHGTSNFIPLRSSRARNVLTLHDCFQSYEPGRRFPSLRNLLFRSAHSRMLASSHLVLCELAEVAGDIRRNFGYAGRIEVVKPPVAFPESVDREQERCGLVHLTNGDSRKNTRAVFASNTFKEPVTIVCSSDAVLEQYREEISTQEVVVAPTRDRLFDLLASSKALLFPSTAEGFGYPIFEALSVGTPVICHSRFLPEDLPEALRPFLFELSTNEQNELEKQIETALNHGYSQSEREDCSKATRNYFEPGSSGRRLLALYDELLGENQ